jgi:hypothetical protein
VAGSYGTSSAVASANGALQAEVKARGKAIISAKGMNLFGFILDPLRFGRDEGF